jgi:hypothetical protein
MLFSPLARVRGTPTLILASFRRQCKRRASSPFPIGGSGFVADERAVVMWVDADAILTLRRAHSLPRADGTAYVPHPRQ